MLKYLLQNHAIVDPPVFVLMLFCTLVAGISLWVLRPGSSAVYRAIARQAIDAEKGQRS